jgi:pimeloyl-ACP methyl ester carboxylesterase
MRWIRTTLYGFIFLAAALAALYFYQFYNPKALIPLRGEFVKVDNARLYVTVSGEGRPVLLLHGFPLHSDSYNKLARCPFPGCRLITLDFPGAGLSDKNSERPIQPDNLALTVKLFLDQAGIEKVDVVGHDLGGGVAMVLASLYPQLVQHLILIAPDSSAGDASTSLGWWWRMPGAGEAWASLWLGRGLIRDLLRQAWPESSQGWMEDVERYARPLDTAGGRQGFLNLNRGRNGFNYLPYEERLQQETLVIWGGADRVTPVACSQALAKIFPKAQFRVLPGVGHLPQEEAPEEVGRLINAFLQTEQSPTP